MCQAVLATGCQWPLQPRALGASCSLLVSQLPLYQPVKHSAPGEQGEGDTWETFGAQKLLPRKLCKCYCWKGKTIVLARPLALCRCVFLESRGLFRQAQESWAPLSGLAWRSVLHLPMLGLSTRQTPLDDPDEAATAAILKAKRSDQMYLANFATVSLLMRQAHSCDRRDAGM